MAKLPTTIRVLKEDIKESPPWADRMLSVYNSFNQAVYDAMSGQLTYGENISGFTKEISFSTLSNYSSGTWNNIQFLNLLKRKALGAVVLQIYRTDVGVYTPIKNGVYVDWTEVNGSIIIGFISGLEDSKSYQIRLRVE
jgi:hypothetical protein